jgi:alpha-mannosidase
MSLTIDQRRKRVRIRIDELRFWIDSATLDLNEWRFEGQPLKLGEGWPRREELVTLEHPQVRVPDEWSIDAARLDLDVGGEGLVRLLYAGGEVEPLGLDAYHKRFRLHDRNFAIFVEAVARFPFGVPNRDPRLLRARLVVIEPAVDRLVRKLQLIVETARSLAGHDVAVPLIAAAERALDSLEWPSGTDAYLARVRSGAEMQAIWELPAENRAAVRGLCDGERASVELAIESLEDDLKPMCERYPREGLIALTGHAHIDLAWLWPIEETRRKAQRTFSTVVELMDQYPELIFNQSTAQLYAFIEQDDPNLFERIQERAARGQWEPVGGMWVEPDTNMVAGESLVRQLLYGQRYFQQHFGTIHNVCWLPDVFGFTPALPQLLKRAGIDNFFTIKLTWSETNTFPYDLFWWEGLDGTRVLAHMFNNPGADDTDTSGYNADPGPAAFTDTWQNYRGKHFFPESLLSIGYGDGGGSVTTEMMERARELENFPALPASHFSTVQDFYDRAQQAVAGSDLPVWLGELYLELHRGTLTSQGLTKYSHRRAERSLVAAETVASMRHLLGGPEPTSLEDHWRVLLRNEFHDILPGSGIREVNDRAAAEMFGVAREASASIDRDLQHIVDETVPPGDNAGVMALNPDLSARPFRVQLTEQFPGAQAVEGGSVLASGTLIPGLGVRTIVDFSPSGPVSVSPQHLENQYLRVDLAPDGTLTRLFDKLTGREVLAGSANSIWAYVDKPPSWDAWDVDAGYTRAGEEVSADEPITVLEAGPHRVALRVMRSFRSSTISQDIRLWSNSPRLDFKTTIDWHDRRWLVKARFPVAVRSVTASFETAFGIIERSTHRNTSWDTARFEVAAHRFVDLSEPGYGVALLNDGKYGHDVLGNILGISLLRSPIYPDPLADEGVQSFTYSLLPHAGGLEAGGVLMESEDLNMPSIARLVKTNGDSAWQAMTVQGLPLGLACLKVLEDGGGLVFRTYEPYGARGEVTAITPEGWSCDVELDLLENPEGPTEQFFGPFQVRSWRLRRSG